MIRFAYIQNMILTVMVLLAYIQKLIGKPLCTAVVGRSTAIKNDRPVHSSSLQADVLDGARSCYAHQRVRRSKSTTQSHLARGEMQLGELVG